MAFCTNCGASVAGAFCTQCGTPLRSASAGASTPPPPPAPTPQPTGQAPQPAPAYAAPAAGTPAAAPRKTSPLVWVLVIVLGLFVLGFLGVVGAGFFVVHKARQAGIDPELMRRNPGLAVGKLLAATNPDVEVVRTDDNSGTITLRNKKDGKVMTMSFDDARNGRFHMTAQDDDGKTASIDIGGSAKLPSWVPSYPGSTSQPTFSIKGDASDGSEEGGNYTFTTHDAPSKVMGWYQDKTKELGMKVNLTATSDDGGTVVASDNDEKRSLTAIVGKGSDETTVNVTYSRKK